MYENLITYYGKLFDFDETIRTLIEKLESHNIRYRSTGDFVTILNWGDEVVKVISGIEKIRDHFYKLQKTIQFLLSREDYKFTEKAKNLDLDDAIIEKLKKEGICAVNDSIYYVEIIGENFEIKKMKKQFTLVN